MGVNITGEINEWNNFMEHLTGYSKNELQGKKLIESCIAKKDSLLIKKKINKALAGIESDSFECQIITRKGKRKDLLLNTTSRRDLDRNIIGVIFVGQDITKRKETEQALLESQQQYQRVTESAKDMIITHEMNGRITFANKATRETIGYSEKELLNMNINQLLPSYEEKNLSRRRKMRMRGNYDRIRYRIDIRKKDGEMITVDAVSSILYQDKITPGILVVARDVTEKQKLIEDKMKAYDQIRENLEHFASYVDSIRNPLNNILAATDLLTDNNLAKTIEKQVQAINEIIQEVDRSYLKTAKVRKLLEEK
jgi:PAS domain S-box-containing protein